MNRIERLTAILLLLQEQPRTAEAIAGHFEVSRRTVMRDVQALCEMGVPIVARPGAGGGYALPDGYRIDPLPLSAGEAFLLMLALNTVARLSATPFAQERASLLAKLRALLPRDQLPALDQALAAITVDIPQHPRPAPFLDALMAALRAGSWVQITYESAERTSTQRVLPRQLSAQGGLWYCRAYAYEHAAERTYRVDRIRALAPADDPLGGAPVPGAPPYGDTSHPRVVVALTRRGVAAAESEPHLGPQIARLPGDSGTLDFRCPPSELPYYARFFAALGADAHVQSPPELRERIRRIAEELLDRYSDQ